MGHQMRYTLCNPAAQTLSALRLLADGRLKCTAPIVWHPFGSACGITPRGTMGAIHPWSPRRASIQLQTFLPFTQAQPCCTALVALFPPYPCACVPGAMPLL